eukprot:scaffold52450_cov54-Phaeocystis_antarctica.AAC.2
MGENAAMRHWHSKFCSTPRSAARYSRLFPPGVAGAVSACPVFWTAAHNCRRRSKNTIAVSCSSSTHERCGYDQRGHRHAGGELQRLKLGCVGGRPQLLLDVKLDVELDVIDVELVGQQLKSAQPVRRGQGARRNHEPAPERTQSEHPRAARKKGPGALGRRPAGQPALRAPDAPLGTGPPAGTAVGAEGGMLAAAPLLHFLLDAPQPLTCRPPPRVDRGGGEPVTPWKGGHRTTASERVDGSSGCICAADTLWSVETWFGFVFCGVLYVACVALSRASFD